MSDGRTDAAGTSTSPIASRCPDPFGSRASSHHTSPTAISAGNRSTVT